MKMDVIASTTRTVAIALGLVLVIGLLLMAWIGSELHYNNCLTKEQLAGKDGSACSHFP
jgi:energy-converting hydrogenase Eha subunit F